MIRNWPESVTNLAQPRPLWADSHQLHQVIVNLITNAHQAMHGGESARRLTIRTRSEALGSRVLLEVADTGPGIPDEVLARIFEPFFTTKPVDPETLPLDDSLAERQSRHRAGTRRHVPDHASGCRGTPGEVADASAPVGILPPGCRILIGG